jgi:hypothetical protein
MSKPERVQFAPYKSSSPGIIQMSRSQLRDETRLRVLAMVTEIAGQAAHNTNVVWMIEFQEELVERLYRKMMALMEEGDDSDSGDEDDEDEDDSRAMVKKSKKKKGK